MTLTKATYSMIEGAAANVLDFGADPTGAANSTAAIQAALNGQGSIYIPDGEYKITADLIIKRDTLVQFGQKAYFKAGANNITFFKSNAVTSAYFTQIHNAQLDGNGFTGVTGFDMYNFRLNAGLFNPNMTAMQTGIIFRYGCFGTTIDNPTTYDDVPYPIVLMDNCANVVINNPNLDCTGNAVVGSKGIDIQVGATIGETIGVQINGGYCQGFTYGVVDTGVGTKINGTYFELCVTADVKSDAASGYVYTGTQHWAGAGDCAFLGTDCDGGTIVSPTMGSGNRSTGLFDYDNTNTNCYYFTAGSDVSFNTPLGVTDGISALSTSSSGTFTPTITGSSSAGTATYSVQFGQWYRNGDVVTFSANVVWTGHTGTGNIQLIGLPSPSLNPNNRRQYFPVSLDGIPFTGPSIAAGFTGTDTNISIYQTTALGVVSLVPMDASGELSVSGSYII
jgi:hypothetical protein